VLLDVQVLHARTRSPVASLQAKDPCVFEEGVRQEILHFSRGEVPLSVVLLFDLTDGVRSVLKSSPKTPKLRSPTSTGTTKCP